jgi:hypothetical protein
MRLEYSIHGLRLRQCPCSVQNFGARTIEAYHIIPAGHSRQAVGDFAVAAAELDGDRTVRAFLCCEIVDRVRVALVLLKAAPGVVDGDRPEAVNRHVAIDSEFVNRLAVVPARVDVEIFCFGVGISAPVTGTSNQIVYWSRRRDWKNQTLTTNS